MKFLAFLSLFCGISVLSQKFSSCYVTDLQSRGAVLGLVGGWQEYETKNNPEFLTDVKSLINNNKLVIQATLPKHNLNESNFQIVQAFSQVVAGTNFNVEITVSGQKQPVCLTFFKSLPDKTTGKSTLTLSTIHGAKPLTKKPGYETRQACHEMDLPAKSKGLLGGWVQSKPPSNLRADIQQALTLCPNLNAVQNGLKSSPYTVADVWHQTLPMKVSYLVEVQPHSGLLGEPNVCVSFVKDHGKVSSCRVHNTQFERQIEQQPAQRYFPCYVGEFPYKNGVIMPGGWHRHQAGNAADLEETDKVLQSAKAQKELVDVVGNFAFLKGVTYQVTDKWTQVVNGVNVLQQIHMNGIERPLCLMYFKPPGGATQFTKVYNAKEDNRISANSLRSFFQGAPLFFGTRVGGGVKNVHEECALSLIGKTAMSKPLLGGFRKHDLNDKAEIQLVQDTVKENSNAIQHAAFAFPAYKPASYKIVDIWKQVVNGVNYVVQIEPTKNGNAICLKFNVNIGSNKADPKTLAVSMVPTRH